MSYNGIMIENNWIKELFGSAIILYNTYRIIFLKYEVQSSALSNILSVFVKFNILVTNNRQKWNSHLHF